MKNNNIVSKPKRIVGLYGGLLIFLVMLFFGNLDSSNPQVTNMMAVALLMAMWWITEVVPLAITSLLPVALFPALGIMSGKDVSATYFNHVIFLFIGGFLVAIAMEKWNLHKRIALRVLMITGVSPARILLGFMLATAFVSMWISNTATAMMMVPILISIIQKLEESGGEKGVSRFSTGLLLGIAYSASIGGIATLVGTPPNLSFARIFQIMFPEAPAISFANWFFFALPVALMAFTVGWGYLYFIYRPKKEDWELPDKEAFHTQYKQLGRAGFEEKVVFAVFVAMALLWMFRADIAIGSFTIPGWSNIFPYPKFIEDGTVAIAVALILFIVPSKDGGMIMTWEAAIRIPWRIVLLFGGGFALASGFVESGLSLWIGTQLNWAKGIHPLLIIFMISLLVTFLTELTSNTATTEMILPVMAGLSIATGVNPLLFMIPATLSASMAFMLPVATPPNAIIFGTNRVTIGEMAKAGLFMNLVCAVIITLMTYFLGSLIFGIDQSTMPLWAVPK